MNNIVTDIDSWLAAGVPDSNMEGDWEPGFEVDRQIVISSLGPYKRVFLRPEKFVQRFYHHVYPISIEEWQCTDQVKLYDGFCTIDLVLDIRFQASYKYALGFLDNLSGVNQHIKTAFEGRVLDIVNRELLNLSDGSWVETGLEQNEKSICMAINEMLILQNIQSQAICQLKPSFEAFPDVQFAKESVYLSVLKKSFEFNEQQKEELFRQQQEEQAKKIDHKRREFKNLNEIAELDRQKQALHAENNKYLLQDKAVQQLEQFEIKKRIYSDKIQHNILLKEMALKEELKEKEKLAALRRQSEEQEQADLIAYKMKIKAGELDAEIEEYEKEQSSWREAKNQAHEKELDLKHRQKQLEFEADVGYKKRYELQRLAMQEESFVVRKNADIYLKREIELLELEEKRVALQLSIKNFKQKQEEKNNNHE